MMADDSNPGLQQQVQLLQQRVVQLEQQLAGLRVAEPQGADSTTVQQHVKQPRAGAADNVLQSEQQQQPQQPRPQQEDASRRGTQELQLTLPLSPQLTSPGPGAGPALSPLPEQVPMDATRIVMHQIVMPVEVDTLGICFGGQVLSWIDVCAGLAAKTLARGPCVTISVDAVHFFRPCRQGQVVIIAATVNRTFSTSMEVGVRVEAEDMRSGQRWHCCSAYLTFVALNSKSKGSPLPRVAPTGSRQQRVYAQAEARRQQRLEDRRNLLAAPAAEMEACRLQPITHREGCPILPPSLPALHEAAARRGVPPSDTTAYMTQSIMPQHANTLGITFGGQVMWWMEQCAYISASRLRGHHLLTAGMDSVAFARPTHVGDIMYITAQVTAIFGSSLEVMISVCAETPSQGVVFHCADAYATVVVVNDACEPVASSYYVTPVTQLDILRHQGAQERREQRLAMRGAMLALSRQRPSLDGGMPGEDLGLGRRGSGVSGATRELPAVVEGKPG